MIHKTLTALAVIILSLAFQAKAQFVITSSGTYSGNWSSGVQIKSSTPLTVTITGSQISSGSSAWGLDTSGAPGSNITVTNTWFQGGTGTVGGYGGGFYAYHCAVLEVANCHFECDGNFGLLIEGPGSTTAFINVHLNDFIDGYYPCVLRLIQNDPNVAIYTNRFVAGPNYQHSDQISTNWNVSGTPGNPVVFQGNLVFGNPDAPDIPQGTGINAGDQGCSYIEAKNNTIINGMGSGIGMFSANGGTSSIHDNFVLGIGMLGHWSNGVGIQPNTGTYYNNTSGWWNVYQLNPKAAVVLDYWPEATGSNTALDKGAINLTHEQNKVAYWNSQNPNCGYLTQPTFVYPQAADFPQ